MLIFLVMLTACKNGENVVEQDKDKTQIVLEKIDEHGMTKEQASNAISLNNGKSWGELPVIGEEGLYYCNLPQNVKGESGMALFCKDSLYGITYFVNCGEDYFIYSQKDGEVELAVEIPAKRLFCRDGKLYFMVESYQKYALEEIESGNILEYNPSDGTVSVIISDIAETMFVYPDGIYYIVNEGEGEVLSTIKRNKLYYSFADGKISEMEDIYTTLNRWNEYFFSFVMEPYEGDDEYLLELSKTKEVVSATATRLISSDGSKEEILNQIVPSSDYLINDVLFSITENGNSLSMFRMNNKEEIFIPLDFRTTSDFIVLEDVVYFGDGLRLELNTQSLSMGYVQKLEDDKSRMFEELYTDGERLFGICTIVGQNINLGKFVQIEVVDTPENAILVQQENAGLLEQQRYEFRISPMWE